MINIDLFSIKFYIISNNDKFLEDDEMLGTIAYDELQVFHDFINNFEIKGKRILEIGGSVPDEFVEKLEIGQWVSVDPLNDERDNKNDYYIYHQTEAINVPYPDDYFDYVFSSNAFEHIQQLNEVLNEIHRVLKKGGIVYSHFGPIWSGPDGHHLEDVRLEHEVLNFWENNSLPHYAHLVHSKEQLINLLTDIYTYKDAKTIADFVYHSDWLNRLSYEDYLKIFIDSKLTIRHLETTKEVDYPFHPPVYQKNTDHYYQQLIQKFPLRDFEVRDILVILKK